MYLRKKDMKNATAQNVTIEEAQKARKNGMYLVTNKDMTKVLLLTESENKAIAASKNNKLWNPLSKATWTATDTKNAMQELALGLQCSAVMFSK